MNDQGKYTNCCKCGKYANHLLLDENFPEELIPLWCPKTKEERSLSKVFKDNLIHLNNLFAMTSFAAKKHIKYRMLQRTILIRLLLIFHYLSLQEWSTNRVQQQEMIKDIQKNKYQNINTRISIRKKHNRLVAPQGRRLVPDVEFFFEAQKVQN